jgi:hypothetical protein
MKRLRTFHTHTRLDVCVTNKINYNTHCCVYGDGDVMPSGDLEILREYQQVHTKSEVCDQTVPWAGGVYN